MVSVSFCSVSLARTLKPDDCVIADSGNASSAGMPSAPPPGLDLSAVLQALAERGVTRLLVEGGARVASSFVAAGLVDEVWLLRGAEAVGADGVAALDALPLSVLTESPTFKLRASETLEKDTLTIYERV